LYNGYAYNGKRNPKEVVGVEVEQIVPNDNDALRVGNMP
jgi:hypothetical protein